MKVEDYSNEITQAQMQLAADHLRRATSAGLSIVIVGGNVSDETGQCAACALSFDGTQHTNSGKAQIEAAFVMLKTAATLIAQLTQGTIKVQLNGPDGPFPVDSGDVREYITR